MYQECLEAEAVVNLGIADVAPVHVMIDVIVIDAIVKKRRNGEEETQTIQIQMTISNPFLGGKGGGQLS